MTKINWRAKEFQTYQKGANWYWIFWSLSIFLVFITFYFLNDKILALLILVSAIMINISHFQKANIKKYTIDDNFIYLNNNKEKISFSELKSYNIDYQNQKILFKKNNKMSFLIQIPFEPTQNVSKMDEFLAKKIKKDESLQIALLELFFSKILGF